MLRLVLLCVVVAANARELPQADSAEDLPLVLADEDLPVGKGFAAEIESLTATGRLLPLSAKIGRPSQTEHEIIPGRRQDNNGTLRLQGCPPISEIPIANDDLTDFFAARFYDDVGGSTATTSCNGNPSDFRSGYMTATYQINPPGTVITHAGCSIIFFEDDNYQQIIHKINGPQVLYNSLVEMAIVWIVSRSMLFECNQTMPHCDPSDGWVTVGYMDNHDSTVPIEFTYNYKVGTVWSTEISQGFDVDVSITETIKASYFGLFEGSVSSTFSTGYNWQSISTEAKSEEKSITITAVVPPGKIIIYEQAHGYCGDSKVQTEMYRARDVETGESEIYFA